MIDKKYLEETYARDMDFNDRLVVLRPETYKEQYREPKYLVVRATGGSGCYEEKVGRSVYYECIYDGEWTRTDRYNVQYVVKAEFEEEVIQKYCK